jgi:hypothetical protein
VIENCPVCGKAFDVQYPHLWRYKRSKTFLCSYGCMRALDDKRGENRDMALTQEQRQQVISMLLKGENPNEYIRGCGIKNPNCTLWNMKKYLQKNDPETFRKVMDAKTPGTSLADAMTGMKDAADQFFGACEDMGLKVEPEQPETTEPDDFDDRTTTTAIRVDGLGEFYHDMKHKSVDWRTEAGDEVSLGPLWWKNLMEELPDILAALGVEV